MTLDTFLREREQGWSELERAVGRARGRPERLGMEGVRRLGALYRATAADLALARRRYPADPVVARLDGLVAAARPLVYPRAARRGELVRFLSTGYWTRVAERPRPLALAWALLLGPGFLAAVWGLSDPAAAIGLVPSGFQAAIDPPVGGGIAADEGAAFSAHLFTHNIRVTFAAFALGIAAGVVTALLLVFNGALLGAVTGLAVEAGNGEAFVRFVVGHGPLELSCIAVTAAAGLRLGWSWVSPGTRPRLTALAVEARAAVEIVLGTMPWLVVAGVAEAYVRPAALPLVVVVAAGVSLAVLYWGLVVLRGTQGTLTAERDA